MVHWHAFGLCLTFLWLIIYFVKYTSRRQTPTLPVSQHRRHPIEVTVRQLSLRLKTEAFNVFHDQLSTFLSSNNSRFLRQVLLMSYDLGSLVGITGMLLGFCLLFFTVASLSLEILHAGRRLDSNTTTKRGMDYVSNGAPPTTAESDLPRLSLIIPGLTVPLGHLPLILLALAVSQIVHESGHAITAALHRIPMISCGFAFTFVLPSAFVTLPAARLEKLPPRKRLQIVSGGCFHNVVLFCVLLFAAWSSMNAIPTRIFFQDISSLGRLVVNVDHDSPLMEHLPVGTLITKIDDIPVASVSSDNPWDHYLLSSSPSVAQGWCTNDSLLNQVPVSTCASFDGSRSCFVSKEDNTVQYKLDPVQIFTGNFPRCNSSAGCLPFASCVVPHRDEQLVRISILRARMGTNLEDLVVWNGPKEEIWEQVQVGHLRPRFSIVSPKLPELASAFFEYMKITNLSLYLINMLPIMALDGYQSLVALLQLFYGQARSNMANIDLEALNNMSRSSREGTVQRVCRTFLSFIALLLVGLCGLLGIVSQWLRK